jgi:cation:H+ antiporter
VVLAILLLLAGGAVLGLGASALTRGVARTLFAGGASPRVVGLALLGVQAGPLLATLLAAARGTPSFAVGIALGSAGYLVCGGLGAGLLLGRRPTPSPPLVAVLLPGLPLVSVAIVVSDGLVERTEGLGLLILFAVFEYVMAADRRLVEARGEQLRKAAARGLSIPAAALTGIGVAAAVVGGVTLLWGGRTLFGHSGLAAGFIAAGIVGPLSALGGLRSCLPGAGTDEASAAASTLAAGNAFCSIASMAAGALGLAALIHPLVADGPAAFASAGLAGVYAPIAVVFAARGKAGRVAGALSVAAAVIWALVAIRF